MQTNPNFIATQSPPVMQSRRWLDGIDFPMARPLINVSQAAPVDAPPLALRQAIADAALHNPEAHLYGPVLGLNTLRSEVAMQWSASYLGHIKADEVAITSGCNQAYCAALATLTGPGDAVLIPAPWYFNHKMWADMSGIETRVLPVDAAMLPDIERAESLIDETVKAILLVSPNNPTGVEYPSALLRAFYDLAKSKGIALIIDETYRDFDSRDGPAHNLFAEPNWQDTLVHLYSFSKAFRLTGHRVGAVIAGTDRLAEIEKFLDTVTICPNQLGQQAALFGLKNLKPWLAGERVEILRRRAAISKGFDALKGWTLKGAGAYFAYVSHPYSESSDALAQRLVHDAAVLMLPGTMFAPTLAEGGDGHAERHMRIAFANVDEAGLHQMFDRLKAILP